MSAKFIVIGGANADIYGQISIEHETTADSNPGFVSIHAGGVARNIAENLAHLGAKLEFIGHFGGDSFAEMLEISLTKAGASTSLCLRTERTSSDSYLAIHNKEGELISAVNNMSLVENIPESFINTEPIVNAITSADLIIIDGNLSAEIIDQIFNTYGKSSMIAVDTVSVLKAKRFIPYLSKIDFIKCNRAEGSILVATDEDTSLDRTSKSLIQAGVGTAIISDSDAGFLVANADKSKHFSNSKIEVGNSSGAGDALFSGFLYAISNGKNINQASLFALRAAETALRFNGPVNPTISALGKF